MWRFGILLFLSIFSVLICTGCMDLDEEGNLVPLTADEDPSLPSISIGLPGERLPSGAGYPDAILHSEAFGNPANPLVFCVHGGPGSDYASIVPLQNLAADGYYVAFWDQRGSGLSQRFDADVYSYGLLLEDFRLVLEHYSQAAPNQPLVIIGHSWGAMLATWFVNEYGDYGGRIQGLILSEPGAFTDSELEDYMVNWMGSLDFFYEGMNDLTWQAQFLTGDDHASMDYTTMLQNSAGIPGDHIAPGLPHWRFGAVAANKILSLAQEDGFDWTTNLAAYTNPVLFLRGELNEAMTLEHQTALAAHYPNAQVVTIPGVGHEMIWEKPDEYLTDAKAYFSSIGFDGGTS